MPLREQRDMEWYLAEQYTGDEPVFHHGAVYGALPDIDFSEGKCILPEIGVPAAGIPEALSEQLDEPFNKALLHLIDAKGKRMWKCIRRPISAANCFPKSGQAVDICRESEPYWHWPLGWN